VVSIANRGYRADGSVDFPFDVYSFHCYSSSGGQRSGTKGGLPPEAGMVGYMKGVKDFLRRYAPWMLLRIGEWGWDEAKDSELNAPAFGRFTAQQTSGMWAARGILCMDDIGVDASSYYMVTTNYVQETMDNNNGTMFWTMALYLARSPGTMQSDGATTGLRIIRTAAGNYFKQEHDLLSGYTFKERISSTPDVIKFTKGTSEIYAIWEDENVTFTDTRPVITERTGTYNLNVKGKLKRFTDDGSGVMSTSDFSGGAITYSANPVFVVEDNSLSTIPVTQPDPIQVSTKTLLKKGYWLADSKRLYYGLFKMGELYSVETNRDYKWYQALK
jgi:hypothetical protein